MFFIVYILQKSQHVVVPYSWLKYDAFMECIVNNGINSNITFEVFYTQNADAFVNGVPLGVPRTEFEPNVHASSESQFPNEGWYRCFIRRFYSMYCLNYMLRNITTQKLAQKYIACGLKTGNCEFLVCDFHCVYLN